jgi:hypothetical protein
LTSRLALIVEGHGDAAAFPLLVERLVREVLRLPTDAFLRPAHRMKRHQMVKAEHLSRAVELQARRVGPRGSILVALDADADCAAALARRLTEVARGVREDRRVGVVVADREFEAWLVASARSLDGKRGLSVGASLPENPDRLPSPKGWLAGRMTGGYSETRDQPAFTALMDLEQAKASRSFRKLVKELRGLVVP